MPYIKAPTLKNNFKVGNLTFIYIYIQVKQQVAVSLYPSAISFQPKHLLPVDVTLASLFANYHSMIALANPSFYFFVTAIGIIVKAIIGHSFTAYVQTI